MTLSIEIRRVGHVVVMDLFGRVSIFETQVKQLAGELIERGERHFVLNLANVSYLDNSGLGQFCWIYTVARNRGGDVKFLKPSPRIKQLLNVTKLDTVFQTFDSESAAVASMPSVTSPLSA